MAPPAVPPSGAGAAITVPSQRLLLLAAGCVPGLARLAPTPPPDAARALARMALPAVPPSGGAACPTTPTCEAAAPR
jgi:hypothetical protein